MSDEARCENCGQIAPVPHFHWDKTGRMYSCQRQGDDARNWPGPMNYMGVCGTCNEQFQGSKQDVIGHICFACYSARTRRQSDETRAGRAVGDAESREWKVGRRIASSFSEYLGPDMEFYCAKEIAAALQREREGAGRDGERLDWLEKRHADVYWLGGTIDTWAIALNEDAPEVQANTLREAIDNAIQGDAAQGEGEGCDG